MPFALAAQFRTPQLPYPLGDLTDKFLIILP